MRFALSAQCAGRAQEICNNRLLFIIGVNPMLMRDFFRLDIEKAGDGSSPAIPVNPVGRIVAKALLMRRHFDSPVSISLQRAHVLMTTRAMIRF